MAPLSSTLRSVGVLNRHAHLSGYTYIATCNTKMLNPCSYTESVIAEVLLPQYISFLRCTNHFQEKFPFNSKSSKCPYESSPIWWRLKVTTAWKLSRTSESIWDFAPSVAYPEVCLNQQARCLLASAQNHQLMPPNNKSWSQTTTKSASLFINFGGL